MASKLVFGTYKHKSTLNRRYNELIKAGIIHNTYKELIEMYMKEHTITNVTIDSTDIINANCSKNETSRSFKLHKQALRSTLICDENKIPVAYRTDKAQHNDSYLGYKLARTLYIPDGKVHLLVGDKGYQMNKMKTEYLRIKNKLQLVVPKRQYKKRTYKTRNYKSKVKRIRHSTQMKKALKNRIIIEHVNSVLHRSFKRLDRVFDKSISSFNGFMELAIICMILHNKHKTS